MRSLARVLRVAGGGGATQVRPLEQAEERVGRGHEKRLVSTPMSPPLVSKQYDGLSATSSEGMVPERELVFK